MQTIHRIFRFLQESVQSITATNVFVKIHLPAIIKIACGA